MRPSISLSLAHSRLASFNLDVGTVLPQFHSSFRGALGRHGRLPGHRSLLSYENRAIGFNFVNVLRDEHGTEDAAVVLSASSISPGAASRFNFK